MLLYTLKPSVSSLAAPMEPLSSLAVLVGTLITVMYELSVCVCGGVVVGVGGGFLGHWDLMFSLVLLYLRPVHMNRECLC